MQKNLPQHFADLKILQENNDVKPTFFIRNIGSPKTVECIRIDGGSDEGCAHPESSTGGQLGTWSNGLKSLWSHRGTQQC